MPAMTIRKIPEETHLALKQRAKQHGRSVEAEAREVLNEALLPKERLKLGTAIHELAMQYGGFDLEIERDQTPAGQVSFE